MQQSLDLATTTVPEGLTDAMAMACLMKRGLEIVSEAGAWDSLPEQARTLFGAALMPSLGSAAKQVADLAKERDDERALSNTLLEKLKERDALIRSLRADLYKFRTEAL